VAGQTINNHFDKIARLYEQGAGMERIGQYVKGWWQWVNAGVDVMVQRAEEFWAQKWDDAHRGIKYYMTSVNGGAHADAEDTRTITGEYPAITETTRMGGFQCRRDVTLFPVVLGVCYFI